jgi:3-phosphoglycerate kinase
MGVFEMDAFAKGTNAIATTLADLTGKVSTSHTYIHKYTDKQLP